MPPIDSSPSSAWCSTALADPSSGEQEFTRLVLQSLCYGAVVGAMSTIVPLRAAELGASAAQLGLVAGSRGLGHVVLVLPVAWLADRFGHHRVLAASSAVSLLAIVAMLTAPSVGVLTAIALAEGLTCSSRLTAINTWYFEAVRQVPVEKAGWFKGAITLGVSLLGPSLGLGLGVRFGLDTAFGAVGALVLVALLGLLVTMPRRESPLAQARRAYGARAAEVLRNPRILILSAIDAFGSGFVSSYRIIVVFLCTRAWHLGNDAVSAAVLPFGIVFVGVTLGCGPTLRRLGPRWPPAIGTLFIIAGTAAVCSAQGLTRVAIGSVVLAVGVGLMTVTTYAELAQVKGDSAVLSGLFTVTAGLGLAGIPAASGALAESFGVHAALLAFTPVYIAAAYALGRRVTVPQRQSGETALAG